MCYKASINTPTRTRTYPIPLRCGPVTFLSLGSRVAQVSVERLFSPMRLLLSDLRSRIKQDAVEAMLLLCTNMV